jgi:hypothetical protein
MRGCLGRRPSEPQRGSLIIPSAAPVHFGVGPNRAE